jgi:hypothetical protein
VKRPARRQRVALLAAVLPLGIGFSSVRLSFVAGALGGSAFIGGNSDRVGDKSSPQKAGGSCASGVACGAMTSSGRAQWVALKNPELGRGRCAPAAFAGEAKFEPPRLIWQRLAGLRSCCEQC